MPERFAGLPQRFERAIKFEAPKDKGQARPNLSEKKGATENSTFITFSVEHPFGDQAVGIYAISNEQRDKIRDEAIKQGRDPDEAVKQYIRQGFYNLLNNS